MKKTKLIKVAMKCLGSWDKSQKVIKRYKYEKFNTVCKDTNKQTGQGFAFEAECDLYETNNGKKVNPLVSPSIVNGKIIKPEGENTPDIIVDNVECQCKCHRNGFFSAKAMYDRNGEYRYPNQSLYLPKGQSEEAKRFFKNREREGKETPKKVIEIPKSHEECKQITKKGTKESIIFDLKTSKEPVLATAGKISCACIAWHTIDLICHPQKRNAKTILKKAGKSVIIVSALSALTCAGHVANCQKIRKFKN